MIYLTAFDPAHPRKQVIGFSQPAGFASIAQAVAVMGEPVRQSERLAIYPGVAISDYPFATDAPDSNRQKYDFY